MDETFTLIDANTDSHIDQGEIDKFAQRLKDEKDFSDEDVNNFREYFSNMPGQGIHSSNFLKNYQGITAVLKNGQENADKSTQRSPNSPVEYSEKDPAVATGIRDAADVAATALIEALKLGPKPNHDF